MFETLLKYLGAQRIFGPRPTQLPDQVATLTTEERAQLRAMVRSQAWAILQREQILLWESLASRLLNNSDYETASLAIRHAELRGAEKALSLVNRLLREDDD